MEEGSNSAGDGVAAGSAGVGEANAKLTLFHQEMRDYLDDLKADFNADSDRALSTNKLFLAKLDRLQAALDAGGSVAGGGKAAEVMLVTPTTAEGVQTSGNVESGANVAQQAHMVAMFTILGQEVQTLSKATQKRLKEMQVDITSGSSRAADSYTEMQASLNRISGALAAVDEMPARRTAWGLLGVAVVVDLAKGFMGLYFPNAAWVKF